MDGKKGLISSAENQQAIQQEVEVDDPGLPQQGKSSSKSLRSSASMILARLLIETNPLSQAMAL